MKKLIIITICTGLLFSLKAQEDAENFKQSAGDKNLELQFDPGAIFSSANNNSILSNGSGIRFRLFISESIAYRLNLNLNFQNITTISQEADNVNNLFELKDKYTSSNLTLSPGIEKHFAGTKRLSPYIGGQVSVGYRSSTLKEEYQDAQEKYVYKTKNGNPGDGLNIGLAALAGADFYFAPKLYLGVELSYGINYFKASKTKITDSGPNTTDIESTLGNRNTLSFQPGALGIFRLGFLF